MQLLIYSPQITPRLKYIFQFIFREVILSDFKLTDDTKHFLEYPGPKFTYGATPLGKELFFKAHPLLTNNHIESIEIEATHFEGEKVPFAVKGGALPFDLFAASFYLLSRYEEYLPHTPDQHFRFPANESLLYQYNLLQKPVVDYWSLSLKKLLLAHFPQLVFANKRFKFIPTIDIDRAYRFKSNGIVKNTARLVKALAQWNTERILHLLKTGTGQQKDPFDTYAYLHHLHQKYQLEPIYFFLLSYKGDKAHDVNIHPNDKALQQLIINTAKQAKVGLHPSYASNTHFYKLNEEKTLLEQLLQEPISISRQHYLKLQVPKTYLQLTKANILHDYTMGYAAQVGFRAGTCTPFFWYDLQLEKQSHLKVHPFAVMDATLRRYLQLNPSQAFELICTLMGHVKAVNGTFYSLWHNESVSDAEEWKGWKTLYEKMLAKACQT